MKNRILHISRIVAVSTILVFSTTLLKAQGGPLDGGGGDGDTTVPVPVKKIDLAVKNYNGQVSISWSTIGESQVATFTIEKSNNATSFKTLSTVLAKNTATANYTFVDESTNATTYYRVKAIDKVGTVTYSSVVVLNSASTIKLNIFPNPAQRVLNVTVVNAKNETALVQIINILGKVVKQQSVPLIAGKNNVSLAIDILAKGSYNVVVKGDAIQQKQFIKN